MKIVTYVLHYSTNGPMNMKYDQARIVDGKFYLCHK